MPYYGTGKSSASLRPGNVHKSNHQLYVNRILTIASIHNNAPESARAQAPSSHRSV